MLIQAAKTDAVNDNESESKRELKEKINQLNHELETREADFDKKLRTMRQEMERIKAQYDQRAGQSAESKLVKQLEKDLEDTKNYYNKRIREIEDKYKYGKQSKVSGRDKETVSEPPKSTRSQQSEKKLAEVQNDLQKL